VIELALDSENLVFKATHKHVSSRPEPIGQILLDEEPFYDAQDFVYWKTLGKPENSRMATDGP
jgi:hypothetical protein